MPKGSKQIKNFSGGLNTYSDPRDIKDNQFQALDNVSTDENARIRLSGGFEKQEITGEELQEISFSRPSSQIASIYLDFNPISIPNQDFSMDSAGSIPSSWEIENGDAGNSGWTVNNPGESAEEYGKGAMNSSGSVSANAVVDLGSITSSGVKLKPGETYRLSCTIMSNKIFYYAPEAEEPRLRIINDDLGFYVASSGVPINLGILLPLLGPES